MTKYIWLNKIFPQEAIVLGDVIFDSARKGLFVLNNF